MPKIQIELLISTLGTHLLKARIKWTIFLDRELNESYIFSELITFLIPNGVTLLNKKMGLVGCSAEEQDKLI